MADKNQGPHLYGTADPDNPPPVAKGGMKGERIGDQEDDAAALQRTLHVDDRKVVVEETSGAAFADRKEGPADEDDRDAEAS
jgi:hypothetical protein